MKKISNIFLAIMISTLSVIFLASCTKNKNDEELTRVTVDINPSVEFIVDEENKVVSVTALNNDGNIIIVGETFIGKTAEEAVQLVVSIATDTGYIVKGEVEASENQVVVSVSGDEQEAQKLYNSIKEEVDSFFDKEKITAVVAKGEAMRIEAMRELVLKLDSTLTEEEVAQMSEQELINRIKLARLETAEIYSKELEEIYLQAKEYEIRFAELEETQKVIGKLDSKYQTLKASYANFVTSFSNMINQIEELQYNYLVSPDSEYQKAYSQLLAAKEEVIAQKAVVAECSDETTRAIAMMNLGLKEAAYEAALQSVQLAYASANTLINVLVESLHEIEASLIELQSQMPEEIKTLLAEKASEIETACNQAKDNFFAKFEEAHADDIEYYKQQMASQKEALKSSIA